MSSAAARLTVLHIGDPVQWNHDQYAQFSSDFTVIRPSAAERQRPEFMKALRERRWGAFHAIFRPFWNTGGEMGRWDEDMIPWIPETCRVFASAGAGFDWADVDLLGERGIIYCNSAAASSESVADFTLFLILSVFRNLQWCTTASLSPPSFTDCHTKSAALSHNPRGHTLGIIGLGNIGFHIASKAHAAFGMRILYHDILQKPPSVESEVDAEFVASLDEMLGRSDCVVLATPASPDGRKLMTGERVGKMKMGSRFINIARGSLVSTAALADALESRRLVGVGLDVHEEEPNVDPRLVGRRNVTLTAHNAGGTLETHIGFESLSMKNITSVLQGKGPLTPVNMQFLKSSDRTAKSDTEFHPQE
ncbi:D-isomer-specific 2-hydroxyacid dehydrogenase-like protein [Amylocarpus encephaloides]|uniref:D-isomer-specific 2-hydroxyacid dehydrogenase-like protein n=1 Tax=Amylocarpus encephaloides TaxID=45428 RepID=A0A9P7YNW4_9HELO|nr:D-isomer-specific 2-hydroxyacid dehydrogenase-like protein [Amylocarpus encephaloides]